jgi:glycosyltransferase involved in cell wall biosynthesis
MMRDESVTYKAFNHVVIAGQMPPPIGGQNINIKRVHDLLTKEEDLCVSHLKFEFTKEWTGARRLGIHKVLELVKVMGRALRIRKKAPIDFLLYPAGGPHTIPIIRDWILLPLLALLSKRVVVHFRAAGLNERLANSSGWFRYLTRTIYRSCASDAVVLAEYGKRDAEAAGIERVSVLPNAFEDQALGGYERENLGVASILSVGHLCADKGSPQLIEAFGRLANQYSNARLVLVGEPLAPYTEKQLLADIDRTGVAEKIEWKGVLTGDDLAMMYKKADLFVFSSVAPYESFGMVLIEAMQWSLPVVVTDWRANVSVCGEGFGGIIALYPEKDLVNSLERALIDALEQRNVWTEWGEKNRQLYNEQYTTEQLRHNLRKLISEYQHENVVV